MARTSRRRDEAVTSPIEKKFFQTASYSRLSEKEGGHGRKDSIEMQKKIISDYIGNHPEMELVREYMDNGVTGTTYNRVDFKLLLEEIKTGRINCVVVKDFSRFGRNVIDTLDLLEIIFPSLGVRFVSILDGYDSDNPECEKDRTKNILKHFMNEYYAKEVSRKLIQSHELSRKKGEYWGNKPPYGYQWSENSKKSLVPDENEKKIVRYMFECYVVKGMSGYEIARQLNEQKIPSSFESHELRTFGECKKKNKVLWGADTVRKILQSPVCLGGLVYGKTKQMYCCNVPSHLIPRNEWEIKEHMMEPLIEQTLYDEAQEIVKTRWEENYAQWSDNKAIPKKAGLFIGRIFCGKCQKRLQKTRCVVGGEYINIYYCLDKKIEYDGCKLKYIREDRIEKAVKEALLYQIKLAADFNKHYGKDFVTKVDREFSTQIKKENTKLTDIQKRIDELYLDYAQKLLDKEEYLELKKLYREKQQKQEEVFSDYKARYREIKRDLVFQLGWSEQLIREQHIDTLSRKLVERFIERIVVYSKTEIEVKFWFGDIFLSEVSGQMQGGV